MEDFEGLPDEELSRLLKDLEEATQTLESEYIPHKKQKEFHMAFSPLRAVFGGNRSGKTEMGTLEARFHATGDYPEWYPKEGRFSGPTRGRIVVTDYKKGANEVLEPKITKWFTPDTIHKIDRFQGHIVKLFIRHKTGGISTIDVMTHEQDSMAFEGWSGHWAWFDEPPPRELFIATLRGLIDFRGRAWLTLTPISEPWLFDEIVGKADGIKVWFTTVDIRDNPYISLDAIAEFESKLLPEEIEARIHGKFIHLAGRVYKEFEPSIHCVTEMPTVYQQWPSYFVLDPADRRPHHGIWATISPNDEIYVYDEIVYTGTIEELSNRILLRERSVGIQPDTVIRILDPNKGRTPTAATGLRLVDEFANRGIYFTASVNDDIALGHLAVSGRLHYDKSKPISYSNKPRLYFLRQSTLECVRQLLSYVWDNWHGSSKDTKSAKETPKDVNKDMPDCVRYLVMSNPCWFQDDDSNTGFEITGGRTGYGPRQ